MTDKEIFIKYRIMSIITERSLTPEVKTERLYALLQEQLELVKLKLR